ncbi:predicted protein, partial [Arabidopsis lyrata subsp. lyrata]
GFESNGNDASDIPKRRGFSRISVEGYETSLHAYDLKLALTKHFASCGKIISIYVPRNAEKDTIQRFDFVMPSCILPEKVPLRRRWNLVEVTSRREDGVYTLRSHLIRDNTMILREPNTWSQNASKLISLFVCVLVVMLLILTKLFRIGVTGYDTSLPKIDVQIGLSKHFSSCGEVTNVSIPTDDSGGLYRFASITILGGKGAVDKALKLSGRNVGGWKITVDMVLPPPDMERGSPSL